MGGLEGVQGVPVGPTLYPVPYTVGAAWMIGYGGVEVVEVTLRRVDGLGATDLLGGLPEELQGPFEAMFLHRPLSGKETEESAGP